MYLCVSYDSQKKINYSSTQRGKVRLGFGNRVFSEGRGRCKTLIQFWRSGDRASSCILIIKPTRCTNFSNLFLE